MPTAILEASAPSAAQPLERARDLLAQALAILDAAGARPEIGARLQQVVDELARDAA